MERIGARLCVRLVQRHERDKTLEPLEHIGIDDNRTIKIGTAMHDAVADRGGMDVQLLA
jgi:hypothetical protein